MNENYKEINIEETIARLHTDEEKVRKLMKMSLGSDLLEKAEVAFSSNNLEEAQVAIHTIKGTCANVGLVGLSKLALEIELKIKEEAYLDFDKLNIMKDVWNELSSQFNEETN